MPRLLDSLAAAYASVGNFDEAVSTARQAVSAARDSGDGVLAEEIERRLQRYEQGQPYRQGRSKSD